MWFQAVSWNATKSGAIFGAILVQLKGDSTIMPLTDLQIRRLKPTEKDQWFTDEKGLRLLIKANGRCYWRLKYRFVGKQKTLALGVYPEVSLKQARILRDEARLTLSKNIDPGEQRKHQKRQGSMNEGNSFSVLAREWWELKTGMWSTRHANRLWSRLKTNTFAVLDRKPLGQIEPSDILEVVKIMEARDALDLGRRVLQDIKRIFSYGVQIGRLKYNPAGELKGVIKTWKKQHLPSMKNSELGRFLNELDQYDERGRKLTQYALKLLVYTFARSGEIFGARWEEIDVGKALWKIPAERMKMGTDHLIPLSRQVLSLLHQIHPLTGRYELLFPSERDWRRSMSNNTMRRAMHRLGYDGKTEGKSKATPHGFRANASSILNEQGFNPDAIERQLSHQERNGVRAAYMHHAQYLDERVKMMQWWADFLDAARSKAQSQSFSGL